jgi:hypothetical protein
MLLTASYIWLMEIPQDQNLANDPTGAHYTINQNYSNVWFITRTLSDSAERNM